MAQMRRPLRKHQQRWVRATYAAIIRKKISKWYSYARQCAKANKRNRIYNQAFNEFFAATGNWLKRHIIIEKLKNTTDQACPFAHAVG